MPWTDVPGARGVRTRPLSETMADPDYDVYQDSQGNWHANKKPGAFTKALPYIIGAGMGYGALASAGVFGAGLAGGGGAASGAGGAAASGVLPSAQNALWQGALTTAPIAGGSQGVSALLAAGGSGALSAATQAASPAAQSRGFTQSVVDWLKNPQNLIGLAGAVPLGIQALRGGGGGGGSSPTEDALLAEIRTNLGLQRERFQAAQPAFQTAQNMAIGMAPVRYRSGG